MLSHVTAPPIFAGVSSQLRNQFITFPPHFNDKSNYVAQRLGILPSPGQTYAL